MNLGNKKIPALGLDIGDRSIKLATISKQGQKNVLTNYNTINLPEGLFDNGKILDEQAISKYINKLIAETKGPKIKTPFVYSCLPETQTFIKLISIPEMTDKEIPEAVRWASEHHIPLPLDQIYLDWQIVNHDQAKKQINILVGAVPQEISQTYSSLIKKSELIPLSLEIEATAIGRALIDEKKIMSQDEAIALIDIGATRTSLIIYAYPSIQFTSSLPFAGVDITKTIGKNLSLSIEQAEEAKIICGLDENKCQGALKKVLDDKLQELVEKLNNSFKYYQQNFENSLPIKQMILCGGGSHFQGIEKFLEKEIQIPSQIGDPRMNCIIKDDKFPLNQLLSYTTAIGLALKSYK